MQKVNYLAYVSCMALVLLCFSCMTLVPFQYPNHLDHYLVVLYEQNNLTLCLFSGWHNHKEPPILVTILLTLPVWEQSCLWFLSEVACSTALLELLVDCEMFQTSEWSRKKFSWWCWCSNWWGKEAFQNKFRLNWFKNIFI